MYVRRVVLENLKGFKALDFDFSRPDGAGYAGWTVLTGDNGSGKTALLKAIALALVGPSLGRALQPNLRGWIREGLAEAHVGVEVERGSTDGFSSSGRISDTFWAELRIEQNGGGEPSLREGQRHDRKQGATRGPWDEGTSGWCVVGYGPFRRLYGTSPEAQRLISGGGQLGRFATLFREDATLSEGEEWLRDLDYRRLENKPREARRLEQVKALLNQDFLAHGVRFERVDSDGLWLRDSAGLILPISELSDGYRAALAMMIDLLRHLADLYPDQDLVTEKDGHFVVEHAGVVLIDEIDAHLHPSWQREIGGWLTRHFPKMQFLVTTHSALVCAAADPGGIFHLPSPDRGLEPFQLDEESYWRVKRSRADQILLSPAFGLEHTRSPEAVEARYDYARLAAKRISGSLSAEEESALKQLRLFVEPDEEDDIEDGA